MKKVHYLVALLFCVGVLVAVPRFAHAQLGEPTPRGGPVTLTDPLGIGATGNAPQLIIGRIIGFILGLVGSLALAMFIYGGLIWMTSAGNDDKVAKGKQIIVWAVAGLALIFLSYAAVNFIITQGILGVGS